MEGDRVVHIRSEPQRPLHVRPVDRRKRRPRSVRRADPPGARPGRHGPQAERARRGRRQPPRRGPGPVREHGGFARRDCRAFPPRARRHRHARVDGDDQPIHPADLQGGRVHGERPRRASIRTPQDARRDRSRSRARRRDLRLLGRPRGQRGARRQAATGRVRALPRGARLRLRLRPRPGLQPAAGARAQAERAARR